jgi:hypothetical protein
MFVYIGKEYASKADVVRELYDLGQISLDVNQKKELAEKLDMTVQTVHATIMKHIGKSSNVQKPSQTITPALTQIKSKVEKVKSLTKGSLFINDKDDEVRAELMKDSNRICVDFAPNQWGLPVTNPPMYVIDENYNPDWNPPPEETIERSW